LLLLLWSTIICSFVKRRPYLSPTES